MKLDEKVKELIAVGASITANCHPCLQYHVSKALESKASKEEIMQAIEVGKLVRKGAAGKMDKFALSLTKKPLSSSADEKCGCGS